MGDGDPKGKCKKVSGTKKELNCSGTKIVAELKIAVELKFGGDPWVTGTLGECKKVSETKIKGPSGTKIKVPSGTKIIINDI